MRHALTETIPQFGSFTTGDTVTISLWNASTEASVALTAGTCNEIGTTGTFVWWSSDITTPPTQLTWYYWEMTNSTTTQAGIFAWGGYPGDVQMISGDSTAADNLEATYDGTGYSNPVAPAQQQQLDQISLTGAALNTSASSAVITIGSQVGTYTNTAALDGIYHQLNDTAGTLDAYYEFQVGADGVPVTALFTGYLTGLNDSLKIYGWDWVGSAWIQIGSIAGQALSNNVVIPLNLYTSMVGTSGADVGKVRIRFQNTGLTTASLFVDQIFVSYAVVRRTVGYSNGAIWIDTNNGSPGTTDFINGTADNPVDNLADATTLSASLGIKRFRVAPGSSLTLGQAYDDFEFCGSYWDLDFNGQSISNAVFEGAHVTGTATAAAGDPHFEDCFFNTVTLPASHLHNCGLGGDLTLADAGTYSLDQCFSDVAGTATPSVDFGAAVADTNLNMRHYSGGIEIRNMGQAGTDLMSLEGNGQLVLAASCTGGTIAIRGTFTVTDNAGGAVTLSDNARYDVQQIRNSMKLAPSVGAPAAGSVDLHLDDIQSRTDESAFVGGMVWVDTINGSAGTAFPLGTRGNPVDNFTDALAIATTIGCLRFRVTGSISIGAAQDISNMTFEAGDNHPTIALANGCTTLNSTFLGHLHISGYFGGHVHCVSCHLSQNTFNLEGFFSECLFDDGNYSVTSPGLTRFISCVSSGQQGQSVVMDTSGAGVDLGIWSWSGKLEIENKDDVETFDIEMIAGELEVASSCVAGSIKVRGVVEVTDNSGPGCNVLIGSLLTEQVDTVLTAAHGAGAWNVTAADTAGAVWEDLIANYSDISTFGGFFASQAGYGPLPPLSSNVSAGSCRSFSGQGNAAISIDAPINYITVSVQKQSIRLSVDNGQTYISLTPGVHSFRIGITKIIRIQAEETWQFIGEKA